MAAVPLLCGLLGVFMANVPISLLGGVVPPPLLALIPLYFWCLVRPDLMTPCRGAFAMGFAEDMLAGGPPGRLDPGLRADLCPGGAPARQFAGLSGAAAVLGFAAAAAVTCCASAYFTIAALYWRLPLLSVPSSASWR